MLNCQRLCPFLPELFPVSLLLALSWRASTFIQKPRHKLVLLSFFKWVIKTLLASSSLEAKDNNMAIMKIGTRGSPLALVQAEMVRSKISQANQIDPTEIEIIKIVTSGDRITDKTLALSGGKGLFTKEIEEALITGEVDLAVHSMKDVPTVSQDELELVCVLEREDVRDGFISHCAHRFEELPPGSIVGTASLRRQAQVKFLRPDLEVVPLRGNVDTRLQKLGEGVVDATLLACAGLNRLGAREKITQILDTSQFLPAVAQGAIGIEIRKDNVLAREHLEPLNDENTFIAVKAERAFLRVMDGSCRTPIAAYAQLNGEDVQIKGQILMPDGSKSFDQAMSGLAHKAEALGAQLGEALREKAGEGFMADVEQLSKASY